MTQQEKRIKLAEFEGWRIKKVNFHTYHVWEPNVELPAKLGLNLENKIPDYFNDLNAVRRVEQKVYQRGLDISDLYLINLYEFSQIPHICNLTHTIAYVSADAETRCEAIAKTLNLW